jgi:serine/threonine-protein kinase RsbW/stage II sporulation protein AB (anti-sigma F factor)
MSTDWLWECGTTSVREPVRWSGRAEPSAVAVVRRLVGDEAVRAGGDQDVRDRLRLAVTEAVTNVVMHAYRFAPEPGDVLVTVEHLDDALAVVVRDHGIGLLPRTDSPGLGLGLGLMAQLADQCEIATRAAGGVEVRLRFALAAAA